MRHTDQPSTRTARAALAALAATLAAVLAAAVLLAPAQAAPGTTKLTLYAVPTTAQFMNHADDRLRGMSTNPFNVNTQALVIITKGNEKKNGPFPGDDILYSFTLYTNPKLTKPAGTAMFTCYYNFVKHATCDSYFDLKNGLILATGQIIFNGTKFTLSITGGTGSYLGTLGQLQATPTTNNSERLQLQLQNPK